MNQLEGFIDLAGRLADAARPEVLKHFRSGIAIDTKSDASPVTEADRAAERVMRTLINETFPEHGILGEEFGGKNIDAEYVWVLDPIDGTVGFVTGKPLFGILIALAHKGQPLVGVIDTPALDERWIGARGRPTTHNGQPVNTRSCPGLDQAWLYATTPDMFKGPDSASFQRLSGSCRRTGYGADCYAYGLLASGHMDLVCEASLGTYDYMALVPVVEGAGGVMTDWNGQALTLNSDGRVVAVGDRAILQATLNTLSG